MEIYPENVCRCNRIGCSRADWFFIATTNFIAPAHVFKLIDRRLITNVGTPPEHYSKKIQNDYI